MRNYSRHCRRYYKRRRYGRDVSRIEVDESERLFQYFEKTDPAHCYRRYICALASKQLHENPGHTIINNLTSNFKHTKSATFEYDIAAKIGHKFRSIDMCEEIYDCPITSKAMDKLFN